MTQWRYYSNVAAADTLASTISNSATSIVAGSGSPQGYPTNYPFVLALEPATSSFELALVTAGAGTSASPWTVTRAADGTLAHAHNAGVPIEHTFSAGDFTEAAQHYAMGSGSGVHGLPSSAWNGNAYSTINETTLANSTTNVVTWSGIPGTYQHLMISVQARLTETTALTDDISLTFNGDTGLHYSSLSIGAGNTTGSLLGPSAANTFAVGKAPVFRVPASLGGAPANAGGGFAWIPNYAQAAFNKAVYSLSGGGNGTSSLVDGQIRFCFWNPTTQAAVTAVSLTAPGSSNFLIGSQFCLYGVG